ncbi:MAG TPA: DNA polymerase III subunit delta' C-terminal domain-containing protein, partial [Candidatus Omnitrophota bacterium]|nr:DNA polymerase III subunit delta' C-terminal domain-containing protein [Candidatus Omnitrophota bacterium]
AEGSLGIALNYHKDGLFSRKNAIINEVFDPRIKLDDLLNVSVEREERNDSIRETLNVLSSWFKDILWAKAGSAQVGFINADRKADIIRLSKDFSFPEIESRVAAIADTLYEISRNVNPRISLTKMRVELWKQ